MLIADTVLPHTPAISAATDSLTEYVEHDQLAGAALSVGHVGGDEGVITRTRGRAPHLLRLSASAWPTLGLEAAILRLRHHEPQTGLVTRASPQKVVTTSVLEKNLALCVTLCNKQI